MLYTVVFDHLRPCLACPLVDLSWKPLHRYTTFDFLRLCRLYFLGLLCDVVPVCGNDLSMGRSSASPGDGVSLCLAYPIVDLSCKPLYRPQRLTSTKLPLISAASISCGKCCTGLLQRPSPWIDHQSARATAEITSLRIYPIKSCAGHVVQQAALGDRGLDMDRLWMIIDQSGGFMTQRRCVKMALVSPSLPRSRDEVRRGGEAGGREHAKRLLNPAI